jgi:uncharacterized spore protein YtfJ
MNEQQTSEGAGMIPQTTFLDHLADRLETAANSRTVFGMPVERNGTTVIPVAKARWGLGGGAGTQAASNGPQVGTGGGGAAQVTPVGFIEIASEGACFRAIRDPSTTRWIVLGATVFGLAMLRTIAQMREPNRRRKMGLFGMMRRFR